MDGMMDESVAPQAWDVVVLGAGAAGLMCALQAAGRGRRVLILDHANKAGKKILMSGGGHCNFTNLYTEPANFLSQNPHFCKSALARYTQWDFIALVNKHGVKYHEKKLGQLFCDNKSVDILNLLLKECETAGARLMLNTRIEQIERIDLPGAQDADVAEAASPASATLTAPAAAASADASRAEPIAGSATTRIALDRADDATVSAAQSDGAAGEPQADERGKGGKKSGSRKGRAKDEASAAARPACEYLLQTSAGPVRTRSLVIATGGLSIPTMGATGFGYQVARQFGHEVLPTRAGLVPFTITDQLKAMCTELSGTSVDCLVSCNGKQFRENILFTHRGLSGPAILQISSYWLPGQTVHINLLPDLDLPQWLAQQRNDRPNAELKTLLGELFTKKMATLIADEWFVSKPMKQLTHAELETIAARLSDWQVVPAGTEGYRTAEVTLGGVDTREVSSKTMESMKSPGLYFIGEVLDVSGHLGGFNFQWAWASAYAAAQAV